MVESMLDLIRMALYALLVMLGFFLFQAWQKDHPPVAAQQTQTAKAVATTNVPAMPLTVSSPATTAPEQPAAASAPALAPHGQIINVKTDVLDVEIDTLGGDIVKASLLKFPESLGSKQPFVLFNNDPKTTYIAESGLLSKQGPDTTQGGQALYTASSLSYSLSPNQNEVSVTLDWTNNQGLKVTKVYTFERNSYEVRMRYDIDNQSDQAWQGNVYTQLLRTNSPPASSSSFMNLATFFGAAISTSEKTFTKINFKDMHKSDLALTSPNGWAAMIQHYFISAWIPPKTAVSNYFTRVNNGLYTIGMIGQPLSAAPHASVSSGATLYAGPAITDYLERAAPNLKLTIDFGMFWFLSSAIFWMMQKIYNVVGNWGWAIVIVTIIIKLMFYQLSAKSFRSMAAMKKLQPKIEILKERYGDDKQKLTQATLDLYRQEKVNPMSGCLPMLIQIPVFIALYWVLVESVQLRQAPFILWIHDLSQQDPYYILPILMGISMFLQQRLNPAPPDPMQAKLMMMMPIIFTFMFANFPAGLMLYWFVNNTLAFLQQWYVMRKLDHAK